MPMDYLLSEVHDEFAKRVEGDIERLDKRISGLESALEKQNEIVRAVDKLAMNMERMLTEQKSQGERLDAIEGRDGDMWRKVVAYIITAILGIVIGFVFKQIGM